MKRPRSPRSRSILAFLAVVLAAAGCARRKPPEWKTVQSDFARLLSSGDLKGAAPLKDGIRERRATMTGALERCTTCHLGAQEPALKDVAVPRPFRFHPDVPHVAKELGCTDCHRGTPTALTSGEAHGGATPILPLRFTEGSCGRCHLERVVTEAPHLTEGRLLISRLGCAGCHEIPGFENERSAGYDLDGLGSKVNRPWLVRWLANPKGYLPSTTMPTYHFTAPEIEALADFLLSSRNERVAELVAQVSRSAPAASRAARVKSGAAAMDRLGCISCHAFAGKGGRVGPDLGRSGVKLRPDWLLAWLKFPKEVFTGTRMPQYSFPDEEVVEIADALLDGSGEADLAASAASHRTASAESIQKGQALFVSSGCIGCHSRSGVSRPAWLAPALSGIGDKSPSDLRFGATSVPRTLTSWLKAKVMSPHAFDPALRMPDFQLAETEADDVTTALLSLSRTPPQHPAVGSRSARAPVPSRDVADVLEKYRCLDCHTLGEKGQPLATDLARSGSKLHREWLASYLRKPYAIRPLVKERMPAFGLSEKEIGLLVEFFKSACVDRALPPGPFEDGKIPPDQVVEGERLFHDRYGCRACHIVGSEGGVYGPSLNGAGNRMTTAWIYAWIRDPKALDPSTRKPDLGLSPEAARALTAYVASQRTPDSKLRAEPERHLAVSEAEIPDEVKGGRRYEAEKGRAVYFRYCAFCHGEQGRGDGPSVERLGRAPTDFTLPAKVSRATLVRAVAEGGRAVGRSSLMPSYARTLTTRQIDEVVTFLQTLGPRSGRVTDAAAQSPCGELKKQWAAFEAFAAGAPPDAGVALERLKVERDAALRNPTSTVCEALARRVEEEREALARRAEALLARDDLDALDEVLSAAGEPGLAPPPLAESYRESAEAFRRFEREIEAKGRAAFAGRAVSWETWKVIRKSLRSGSLTPEHRALVPELERMGLVRVRVELKG